MKHEEIFGAARWIASAADSPGALFRGRFTQNNAKRAVITIGVLGFFYLYINGVRVSEDMFLSLNTDYEKRSLIINGKQFEEKLRYRLYCPQYDITGFLREGDNLVAVETAPGWYCRDDGTGYGNTKICWSIKITMADGSAEFVYSDSSVKWCKSSLRKYNIIRGEEIDCTQIKENWEKPEYDDSEWELAKTETAPVTELFYQDCPADKIIRKVIPKLIAVRGNKKIYDAGEMITGYPVLSFRGGHKEHIAVRYGETVTGDGLLNENKIYFQHTDFYTDEKKRRLHPLFTWYCFRYFEVSGSAVPEDCCIIHSDISVTSAFHCDNEIINWIYDAYIRTQLCNMHCGIPSDCPHIERRGYTGDGQLTCECALLMLDACRFYKKWIYDIADCQDSETGHVQYTAPFADAGGGPGGWGCAIAVVPYVYYKHSGDKSVLTDLYPHMLKYFGFLENHSKDGLVVSDVEGAWCLGDWCTPRQFSMDENLDVLIPAPLVNTYFYIKALQIAVKTAKLIGRDSDIEMLTCRIAEKKRAISAKYYNEDTGDFAEGFEGANAFAIDIGLGNRRTLSNMVERYEYTGCYDTGIFGTDVVTGVLFENGEAETAIKLLTSKNKVSFYSQMKSGATTLWETWNDMRSRCHPMFGAVTKYFFRYILGIRQTENSVCFNEIIVNPVCTQYIKKASGSIKTKNGIIEVAYNNNGKETVFDINIPQGTGATFVCGDRKAVLRAGKQKITV